MIALEQFALAGNATFTVVSKKSGKRFTYRVRRPSENTPHFVQLMNGSDNENSFCFMGTIFDMANYRHSAKARVGVEAPSAVAFQWTWNHRNDPTLADKVEIHHEGKCCRCGRKLTTPESVTRGIGPECAGKVNW